MYSKQLFAIVAVAILASSAFVVLVYNRDRDGGGGGSGFSFDIEPYRETAIESLMASMGLMGYDVFSGYIDSEEEGKVEGLAVCNYSQLYADGAGNYAYPAGFIPTSDRELVAKDLHDNLIIANTPTDHVSYMMTYVVDNYVVQFVSEGHFITYGVNANGCYFFDYEELEHKYGENEFVNEVKALADPNYPLFDYDSGHYLNYLGGSEYIDAKSLTKMDYSAMIDEVNQFLSTQMEEFYSVNAQTYIELSKEALEYYYASDDSTTVFGFTLSQLKEQYDAAGHDYFLKLDDGALTFESVKVLSEAEKLLWGIGCAVVMALAVVVTMVPGVGVLGAAVASGVISAAIDTMVKTTVMGIQPDVTEIMIAAVSGFLCAGLGVAMGAIVSSALAGVGEWISTGDFRRAAVQFGVGAVCGILLGTIANKFMGTVEKSIKFAGCSNNGALHMTVKASREHLSLARVMEKKLMYEAAQTVAMRQFFMTAVPAQVGIEVLEDVLGTLMTSSLVGATVGLSVPLHRKILEKYEGANEKNSLVVSYPVTKTDDNGNYLYDIKYSMDEEMKEVETIEVSYRNRAYQDVDSIKMTIDCSEKKIISAYVVEDNGRAIELRDGHFVGKVYTVTEYRDVSVNSNYGADFIDLLDQHSGETLYRQWSPLKGSWIGGFGIYDNSN